MQTTIRPQPREAVPVAPRITPEMLALWLILAVALVLRFRGLLNIEHNVDYAYPIWQALTTLDRGALPLAGQGTSVLFANPPLTGYFYVPVLALIRSPLAVYVFVIALNTLGVYFTYRATRSLLGVRLALIAAALMAVNPWVIEYSRATWVQGLLAFFVPAVAWLLWPVLRGTAARPVRRTALALVMAALLAHTYLLAFFIVAPVGLLLLIYRRRIPLRGLFIGGGVFALLLALYGAGLLGQRDDVQARMANFSSGESQWSAEAWNHALRLVSGADYELVRGTNAPADDSALRHDLARPAVVILHGLILLGMAAALWAILRGTPRREAGVIALVWFGLPVLAMSYTGSPVHPFYQLMGLPAGYVLAAWGAGVVFRPQTRTGAVMVLLLFVPFALLMSVNSARHTQETAAFPTAHRLYAPPLGLGMQIGAQVTQRLAGLPGEVVFAEGEAWILNSLSGRLFPVWNGVQPPGLSVIPAGGGVMVEISPDPVPPFGAVDPLRLDLAPRPLLLTGLPPASEIAADGLSAPGIPSQQGITLVGASLVPDASAAQTWRVRLLYRVESVAPDVANRLYGPFVHVFDADGQRVANVGGDVVPGSLWAVGDLHYYELPFTLPPDVTPVSAITGLYDGVNNANVIYLPPDDEASAAIPLAISP